MALPVRARAREGADHPAGDGEHADERREEGLVEHHQDHVDQEHRGDQRPAPGSRRRWPCSAGPRRSRRVAEGDRGTAAIFCLDVRRDGAQRPARGCSRRWWPRSAGRAAGSPGRCRCEGSWPPGRGRSAGPAGCVTLMAAEVVRRLHLVLAVAAPPCRTRRRRAGRRPRWCRPGRRAQHGGDVVRCQAVGGRGQPVDVNAHLGLRWRAWCCPRPPCRARCGPRPPPARGQRAQHVAVWARLTFMMSGLAPSMEVRAMMPCSVTEKATPGRPAPHSRSSRAICGLALAALGSCPSAAR